MKITSREQAASEGVEFLWIGFEAGLVASWTATVDGHEYTLQREPEPVVMYTGSQIIHLVSQEFGTVDKLSDMVLVFGFVRDLILARRAEMLRAMRSKELVSRALCTLKPSMSEREHMAAIIALITEHIEANRPELTDAMIDEWGKEWWSVAQHELDGAKAGTLARFFAHRAAEYRSPAVAELRVENERLKSETLEVSLELTRQNNALTLLCDLDETGLEETRQLFATAKSRIAELELELGEWRTNHACCGSVDELHEKQAKINELSDLLRAARDDQLEKSKKINSLLPQPVDDSDEYGILVQDGGVYLMKRKWMGLIRTVDWETNVRIVDVSGPLRIDPARIFKVTSQPRGPLKVPSEEKVSDLVAEWHADFKKVETTANPQAFARYSVHRAIKWIKKANEVKV